MKNNKRLLALLLASALLLSACASNEVAPASSQPQESPSSSNASTPPGGTSGAALTDEERLKSTYNPIYMGADVDHNGNPLVIGTDEEGQIANQAMIDHHKQFTPKVDKITDNIHAANGYGLANSVMIETDNGVVIVDTNDSIEAAQKEYEEFRKISDKPVVAVIYSHFHYVAGTQAYIPAGNPDNIPIIAHEDHEKNMTGVLSEISTVYVDRLMRHHGGYLDNEGEDGLVGCALGPYYNNPNVLNPTSGYLPPNQLLPRDKMTEMEIDGVKFQFIPQPSDSDDSMIIWLPDEKVAINNLAWPTFPNIYTLRGEPYRDPRIWMGGIEKLLALQPEHLVGAHGLPMSGTDKIQEELNNYRDGIQYLYDQTVRYMNRGYSPDEIVEAVKVPAHLTSGVLGGEYYGEMEYHIRGIYGGIIGWFGTDTIELHPVTPDFEAQKIIEGFGGKEVVIAQSKAALADKQYSWAAQLITYVLELEPDNAEAKQLKADALRKMAQVTTASTTRHFYLSQALELEGKLDKSAAAGMVSKDKLMGVPRDTLLKILRASIDPEKCMDMEKTVKFTFTDENVSYGIRIRKGVGQVVNDPANADIEIQVPYQTLVEVIVKEKEFAKSIESGEIKIVGDMALFQQIMGIFDMAL